MQFLQKRLIKSNDSNIRVKVHRRRTKMFLDLIQKLWTSLNYYAIILEYFIVIIYFYES